MSETLPIELDVRPSARRARTAPAGRRTIVRTVLLHRLCAAADVPVVAVVAPAGYGKTTLLAQWAARDRRRALWLTLGPEHDDAAALAAELEPAVAERGALVLLDDLDLLRSAESLDVLRGALERVPEGTTIAFACRTTPALPLPRLRAEGRLLDVGADDLALRGRDAQSVLRHAGVLLPEREANELEKRTEGWPAALVLAALSLRTGCTASAFAGDDRFVADYLETEHLAQLTPAQHRFATATSVLDELTPEACDTLLGRRSSGRMLDALERLGIVVPLDHDRSRYRYRRLVRDVLLAELERDDPERARSLHRAAAEWSRRRGASEEALRHAAAAGDLGRVAELAARIAAPTLAAGRLDTVEDWLELLGDEPSVDRHPDLCIAGSWLHALRGRPAEAQRWVDAAQRGAAADEPRLRLLHALRCRDGVDPMLDDASAACLELPPGSCWRPSALAASAAAHLLAGDSARAERDIRDAIEAASAAGATDTRIVGLCVWSILAADRGASADADALVADAEAAAAASASDPSLVTLLLHAASARAALRRGDRARAAAEAARAAQELSFISYAAPWLSAIAALELVHVHLGLADADAARGLLRRIGEIRVVRPRLGALLQRAAELDRRTRALAAPEGRWASSLTPAETRLLPLLATHLSFREIGERLYVSRNTVKTQAISVYRKFGVSSRSDAIARATDLGLIDESPL